MKFQGKIVRRQMGGPMNAVEQNALDRIKGLSLGAPSQFGVPTPSVLTTAQNAGMGMTQPPAATGKRPDMQEMLRSAMMGGLAGFGGPAGIGAGLAMQIIPLLAEAFKKKKAPVTQKNKGGGPLMKGKTGKPMKPAKPAKKVAMKKAYGGKMKKAC